MHNTEIIKLKPCFKDYLWGGSKLKEKYNKHTDLEICAESWELSAHPNGESVVDSGEFKDCVFSEYLNNNQTAVGKKGEAFDFFPMLIKFIDAKDNLSIQVHPDDTYAMENHGEYGKTEMWYILDAEEDASLYYGFTKKISKEEFAERIKTNTLLEVLNSVKVKKGDVFFIEAGTVHAIGKGIVICEIQQNSNITYRVYDYDRRDAQGNARELHIDRAVEVSKTDVAVPYKSEKENILASCKYFTVERMNVFGKSSLNVNEESFKSVIVAEGSLCISDEKQNITAEKGDSIFIPAQNKSFTLEGECELVISYL